MVNYWPLGKHSLKSWIKIGFALRKGAAAEQFFQRADQQEKANTLAQENNPVSVLWSA